jgi:hypothetical protein
MGLPKHQIPDAMFRLMSKEEQQRVRPSCAVAANVSSRPTLPSQQGSGTVKDSGSEKQLQDHMANLLNQRTLFYLRSRMDKKTTLPCGMPDFFIFLPNGRFLAVEAKVEGGKLSDDQKRVFDRFWAYTGHVVHIVWTFQQFVDLLNLHNP